MRPAHSIKRMPTENDNKKRSISISIYYKIVIALFLLLAFFSGALIIYNVIAVKNVRNEIISSEYSKLEYFSAEFEDEVSRILIIQKEYLNDGDLQMLSVASATMSNYEKQDAMKDVYEKLSVLKSSSSLISEVRVHVPAIQKTISTESGISDINTREFEGLSQFNSFKDAPIIKYEDGYYLSIIYPASYGDNAKPISYNMLIKLSYDKIQQHISNIASELDANALLKSAQYGWNIANNENAETIFNDAIAEYATKDGDNLPDEFKYEKTEYSLFFTRIETIDMSIFYFLPQNELFAPISRYKNIIIILFLISAVILLAISYWIYSMFKTPLDRLVNAFKVLETGKLDVKIEDRSAGEFRYLYMQFNNMTTKLRQLITDVYESKIRLKSTVLKQLQYQINPHFLYNSFYIIYRMAKVDDSQSIAEFVNLLSNYYKYINNSDASEIELQKEIQHCINYIKIQSVRFKNRISLDLNYDEESISGFRVPYLVLQPIVENVYEHGLANVHGKGEVKIDIKAEQGNITIAVEDNGQGMSEKDIGSLQKRLQNADENSETSGIENVHRRLRIKYGGDSGIYVSKSPLGGLRVTIKINHGEENV